MNVTELLAGLQAQHDQATARAEELRDQSVPRSVEDQSGPGLCGSRASVAGACALSADGGRRTAVTALSG